MTEVISWMVLLVVLVAVEIATMGLTTIWFAAGALAATIAAACNAPLFVQIALFLIVSVLMLVFTRPVAMKYFNVDRTKTNVESLIGQKGIVTGEISNIKACGQVTLNGMEWTARAAVEDEVIPEGTVVIVKEIHGVKLIVETEE
ncbi:MAG: NfeD family protein [Lachnospiraceae bacterium]|nr:NfeD family protein [Lachnospiraceae bacterium]